VKDGQPCARWPRHQCSVSPVAVRRATSGSLSGRALNVKPANATAAALVRLGRYEEAKSEAREVLALDPTFTIDRFSATVGIEPVVFLPLAKAWRAAGLPKAKSNANILVR
jgi:hypothetical protein